jgi:tetratricopeptide (TPR) repeat protein
MGEAKRAEAWLLKLNEIERATLRPAALRARVAVAIDPQADVEAIIEPRAANCLAEAKNQEQKHKIFSNVGNLYRELSRMQAAERWFAQLVSERPAEYAKTVEVLVAQRRLGDAISLCERAAQSDDSPQPALVLAAALVEGQASAADFERAEPLLAKSLIRFDSNANLLYAVALIRILQNSNDDAISLLRRVVVASPRNVPALNNLALLLSERTGDREEALRLIDEAIKVAGPAPGLLDTKGSILVYAGRSAEAIEPLLSATRTADADPRHHFHLALAYRDTGRVADAKKHMQIAIDRQLTSQVLTATDRDLLTQLLDELRMNNPVSATTVMR